MKMKKIEKIIPIVVALFFIGVAITPSTGSQHNANNEDEQVLTFIWQGESEEDISLQKDVTEEQAYAVNVALDEFLDYAELALEDQDITSDEWTVIAENSKEILTHIKTILNEDIPDIDTSQFVDTLLGAISGGWNFPNYKAPIFSIGRGICWIPFYDYESFFGMMLRPMFVTHTIGFTACFHMNWIPIRFEYLDRLGLYSYTTLAFNGLFINIGDIGIDKIVGPVLMMGRSYNFFGEDLP
jgi:hypothetical protein